MDELNRNKKKFLLGWLGVNLLGWIIGVFSGLYVGEFYLAPIIYLTFTSEITRALSPLFVWLPHGAWIGIMQWGMLKKWKIQPVLWVIATSLGWGIPATAISLYHENFFVKQFGYSSPYEIWFYGLGILLVGASVGLAQVLVMGNAIAKRALWILANALGLLACILLLVTVIFLAMYLFPPESSLGGRTFGFLMWVILFLTLPFVGMIPSLATGLYLLKYGYDVPEGESNKPTNEIPLNQQTS